MDVAKSALDVAVSNSDKTRRFGNDAEGYHGGGSPYRGLKPAGIIPEASGRLEMSLVAGPAGCSSAQTVSIMFTPKRSNCQVRHPSCLQFPVSR